MWVSAGTLAPALGTGNDRCYRAGSPARESPDYPLSMASYRLIVPDHCAHRQQDAEIVSDGQAGATAAARWSTRPPVGQVVGHPDGVHHGHVAVDDPWLITHTPSTPSSMAPPVFSGSSSAAMGSEVGQQDLGGGRGRLVGGEDPEQGPEEEPQRALERLEGHVAGEPVGDDHVGRARRAGPGPRRCRRSAPRPPPARPSSAWVSFTSGRALGRLLADGEQRRPSARRCRSGRRRRRRPSGRTGPASPAVHSALAPASTRTAGGRPEAGHRRGDAGPDDPGQPAHPEQRRRHGGPGVAGADHGRGPAVAHQLGGRGPGRSPSSGAPPGPGPRPWR